MSCLSSRAAKNYDGLWANDHPNKCWLLVTHPWHRVRRPSRLRNPTKNGCTNCKRFKTTTQPFFFGEQHLHPFSSPEKSPRPRSLWRWANQRAVWRSVASFPADQPMGHKKRDTVPWSSPNQHRWSMMKTDHEKEETSLSNNYQQTSLSSAICYIIFYHFFIQTNMFFHLFCSKKTLFRPLSPQKAAGTSLKPPPGSAVPPRRPPEPPDWPEQRGSRQWAGRPCCAPPPKKKKAVNC